jgi:flagellar biosynthesis/type III secretory pathway protein FliH
MKVTALGRVVLFALRSARRRPAELLAQLPHWASLLAEILRLPGGVEALGAVVRYILEVSEIRPEDVKATYEMLGERGKEAYVTGEEILEQRGLEKGREKGREEGLEKGREEGRLVEARSALRRVFARRGLALSAQQEERIASAMDLAELERWLDGAIVAATADEVLT